MSDFLTVKELSEYLLDRPKIATIYLWTCKGKIPFFKRGKKLLFWKKEIDEWEENGRKFLK